MDSVTIPIAVDSATCVPGSAGPGLLEAHRLAHGLNGALLEAAGASGGIQVLVGSPGEPDRPPGTWTAVLRSGPGGIYVMVAPATMVWGMPEEARCPVRPGGSWNRASLHVLAALGEVMAAGLPVAVRTRPDAMVLVDGPLVAIAPGVLARFVGGQVTAAPLAYRLF